MTANDPFAADTAPLKIGGEPNLRQSSESERIFKCIYQGEMLTARDTLSKAEDATSAAFGGRRVKSMPMRDYEYYRKALARERLPAAFIDLDALAVNLGSLAHRAGGLPIRLATQSIRSIGVIRLVRAVAPFLRGLLCYSAAEAAWLGAEGFDDLVVASPTLDMNDLRAVALQSRAGTSITMTVDSVAHIERLDAIAFSEALTLPVAMHLDVPSDFHGIRFGLSRSLIQVAQDAVALADEIARRPNLRLDGLVAYASQIAELMDDIPGRRLRNRIARQVKRRSIAEENARCLDTVNALARSGHRLRFVNGGGSTSRDSARRYSGVTGLSTGSDLYAPALLDHCMDLDAIPAAGFALPISRIPKSGISTCSGGGYCASGRSGSDRLPTPWLPHGCSLIDNVGAGDFQTLIQHPSDLNLRIGDPIMFRHAKAGELCEHFNELLLIQDGLVVNRVKTYRGDGKCFV